MIEVTPFMKTMLVITSIIIEHWYGKIDKGHYDLDKRHGYYDDENDGGEKDDHRDDNYYEGEGNEEGENFEENGHYRKGYSTHSHQYKKYKDFYDEDYDSDFNERNGGYHYDHERENGRYYNEGRHDCNE